MVSPVSGGADAVTASPLLRALSEPGSVAVVGASDDVTKLGGRPVANLLSSGYPGRVLPVNPSRSTVQRLPAFATVQNIPDRVDVAEIIIPAPGVPDALRQCAEKGVSLAIVFSSGFAEAGPDGQRLQDEVRAICEQTGIHVLGPNTVGAVAAHAPVVASFASVLRAIPRKGSVALVSQSGGLSLSLYLAAQSGRLGLSHFVNTGNEVDLTVSAVVRELVEDPHVAVMLTYFEAVNDVESLVRAAARSAALDKPIVALKAGRSNAGARAAESHTAALAGADAVADACFRELGILRVDTTDDLLDAGTILADGRRAAGRRLSIITVSGGGGVLSADLAEDQGLVVEEWDETWQERLRAVLPAYASPRNPVDITAAAAADPRLLEEALSAAVEHPGTDMILVFLGDSVQEEAWRSAVSRADRKTDKPIAVVWVGDADPVRRFAEIGVPAFPDPARAMRALGLLCRYSLRRREAHPPAVGGGEALHGSRAALRSAIARAREEDRRRLDEIEAKRLLAAYGIGVVQEAPARDEAAAAAAAGRLGYPVAVKLLSAGISHKTEWDGVRLGLGNEQAIRRAAGEILQAAIRAGLSGAELVVQRMVAPGLELLLGARHDPVFGPIVTIGAGGLLVEILGDVAIAPAPLDREGADRLLSSLRVAALLNGVRGQPRRDRTAVVDALVRLSALAADLGEALDEIEVNPLIVGPEGAGAIAVDALVHLRPPTDSGTTQGPITSTQGPMT